MAVGQKRKRTAEATPCCDTTNNPITTTKPARPTKIPRASLDATRDLLATSVPDLDAMGPQLERIAASDRTAFEKRVLSLLCQIPAGRVSTYGLVAARLGSAPRAVGNALRRNPFAPEVPCHRVVATGGALGGFKGHWSTAGEGVTIDEKKRLLRREGVRIDDKGRVLGSPWGAFA